MDRIRQSEKRIVKLFRFDFGDAVIQIIFIIKIHNLGNVGRLKRGKRVFESSEKYLNFFRHGNIILKIIIKSVARNYREKNEYRKYDNIFFQIDLRFKKLLHFSSLFIQFFQRIQNHIFGD